jgi:hypothetical protein
MGVQARPHVIIDVSKGVVKGNALVHCAKSQFRWINYEAIYVSVAKAMLKEMFTAPDRRSQHRPEAWALKRRMRATRPLSEDRGRTGPLRSAPD